MRGNPLLLAAALLIWKAAAEEACSVENIDYVLSRCEGGNAKVVPYWKNKCETSSVNLPGQQTVNCTEHCEDGKFFSASALECVECPAGTFSDDGTLKLSAFNKDKGLPDQMVTYCHTFSGMCSGWDISDKGLLTSGTNNEHTMASTLVWMVNVDADSGTLGIEYRMESEKRKAEFLVFIDDRSQALPVSSGVTASGIYKTASFYLSKGKHIIRMSYKKDGAEVVEGDRVFVRTLTISGQQRTVLECSTCPAGEFSESGSAACTPCKENTKRSLSDPADKCIPCEKDFVSSPGSSACSQTPVCETTIYKACKGTEQEPAQQTACKPAPAAVAKECSECPPGTRRNANKCEKCPEVGHVFSGGSCKACDAGTFAQPKLQFSDFAFAEGLTPEEAFRSMAPDLVVKNECHGGLCREPYAWVDNDSGGWTLQRFAGVGQEKKEIVALSSGMRHGDSITTMFSIGFHSASNGILDFKFFFGGVTACTEATIAFDTPGYQTDKIQYLPTSATAAQPHSFSQVLKDAGREPIVFEPGSEHLLTWTFIKIGCQAEGTFNIFDLTITSPKEAPASECIPCEKGHMCPGAKLQVPCEAGTHQDEEGKDVCKPCEGSTANRREGQATCEECGERGATDNHLNCNSICTFKGVNGTIDLSKIGKQVLGPVIDHQQVTFRTSMYAKDLELIQGWETNTTFQDENGIQRYYLRLCDTLPSDEVSEFCPQSFACQKIDQKSGYGMGDWFSGYTLLEDSRGLELKYTEGEECLNREKPYPRTTTVTLLCDPGQEEPKVEYDREESCDYYLKITTSEACVLCTESSFVAEVGECDPEKLVQRKSYHRKTGSEKCVGTLPPEETVPCSPPCKDEDWLWEFTECKDGKQHKQWVIKDGRVCTMDSAGPKNGKDVQQEERSCYDDNKVTIVFIIVAAIGVMLLICVCAMYRSKRAAEAKYSRLAQGQGHTGEMTEFPTTVVQGDDYHED